MNSSDNPTIPRLAVGLLRAPGVEIDFIDGFRLSGRHRFEIINGRVTDNGRPTDDLHFEPTSPDSVFEVGNVVIGIGFHWERRESQRFRGAVEIKADGDAIVVINHVDVEDYLKSVISSEMSATASPALLKAHAVISRSWVLAQIGAHGKAALKPASTDRDTIIRWYDREDHELFDVCADDHCQRYQGITRQTTDAVNQSVEATRGEVLTYGGQLCDARFSKCCGGMTERFQSCWEDTDHPYLDPRRDMPDDNCETDLSVEPAAATFINSRPESFCNTTDPVILSQVLNNYDQETADFYRWEVTLTSAKIGDLIRRKAGIDLGDILTMTPLQRGSSGRITRLQIDGSLRSVTVGKELEIRRWLSETHLYSSAFTIETEITPEGRVFTLTGAGWGHGVGLCQIGAAVMGAKGYGYREILAHYYPGADISRRY